MVSRDYIFKHYQVLEPAELILKGWPNGYECFHIVGKKGLGKTTYAMYIMAQVFFNIEKDVDIAWDLSVKHLLYTRNEMIKFINKHDGDQAPVVTWDDIRTHAGRITYFTDVKSYAKLSGMMDVLRSSVCGFITTSPSMNGVMKVIADETGYKVMILNSNNNNTKCAKVYVRYETPWGQMRVKKVFKNEFPFHLPDDIFEKVMKKRRMYNKEIMSSEVKEYGKDN